MENKIKKLKDVYRKGMKVKLIKMNDAQAVPPGTEGTIVDVDDIGTIHVKWDTGSSLGPVEGNRFEIIAE